ncbi:hypothetical protein PTTG_05301 [Puccinia triticina 1-1 BBBD Race 1]|uniref:Uncharacterized protein n=1 Tax=Puccinia triticina (isolate 1-1 / race 1 (BBBD)) TaxID=630390 RepID=A0A180G9W2_PUCT1|nr:hypothetical protein PTTG_05301 [Puccinia triticina 1-1 BBBD Race 1]WAR56259.1 hypothetical protein PtB15_7B104 [Puccinia triticina]
MQTLALLQTGLGQLRQEIWSLVGSDLQQLNSIATDFLASLQQGKHLRPLVVLSIAQASAPSASRCRPSPVAATTTIIIVIASQSWPILPTQRRLAQIAELIPISLLWVDVINQAESRRGDPLRPAQVGQQAHRSPATSYSQEPRAPSRDELGP